MTGDIFKHKRPDIVWIKGKRVIIIGIGRACDKRVLGTEQIKKKKDIPRIRELQKIYRKMLVDVPPVNIGRTGAPISQCINNVKKLRRSIKSHLRQKTATMETALLVKSLLGGTNAKPDE